MTGTESISTLSTLSPEDLTPCPCGNPSVWYHVTLWPVPDQTEVVKVLRIDDSYDDLCDECFQAWVPDKDREGWQLIDNN